MSPLILSSLITTPLRMLIKCHVFGYFILAHHCRGRLRLVLHASREEEERKQQQPQPPPPQDIANVLTLELESCSKCETQTCFMDQRLEEKGITSCQSYMMTVTLMRKWILWMNLSHNQMLQIQVKMNMKICLREVSELLENEEIYKNKYLKMMRLIKELSTTKGGW
nr:uncharacterized protein LOC128688479 [Cherax quadricarinatus]